MLEAMSGSRTAPEFPEPKGAKAPRKKRNDKPIIAMQMLVIDDKECMLPVEGFPLMTNKKKVVAWAKKQAPAGAKEMYFFRSCGKFKATAQTVMNFDIE